ncbi:MAG: D-alanine--D-alanine ligase [Lentisphaerae bacterium]|nr:D-alanine--D-alanine ligase [Lentisphaerota bacterium]
MQVALVYSSKKKAQEVRSAHRSTEWLPVDDDEPPDLLAEYDTEDTVHAVARALSRRHRVVRVDTDDRTYARLKAMKPSLVFNISEGWRGQPNRESHIPSLCEILGLPFTGSDALTLGICLDKARTKEILSFHGIPTARFRVADARTPPAELRNFPLPAIVKPLREGSSMGIANDSVVKKTAALERKAADIRRRYREPALIEEFLPGREFTVGVVGNAPRYEFLPIAEIDHRVLPRGANPVYGFEAKWVWDDPARPLKILVCPARISGPLKRKILDVVRRALEVLRVRDWCRVDVRLDGRGSPKIIELNPLPGILPDPGENSALPAAARAAGWTYDELILRVAEEAIRRQGLRA